MAIPADVSRESMEQVVPRGRLEQLRALGHDFLEGKREGAYVYDVEGARYLDGVCGAGTFNLGHRHPAVAQALKEAVGETDQGNFPMISQYKAALAKSLSDFVPGPLECVVYGVMRGEAMDCACKVARGFTGRTRLVTVDGGWYGQCGFALTLSQRDDRDAYGPLIPDVGVIPFGDIEAANGAVNEHTAAVILEPIQAENHCRDAGPAYLEALARRCRGCGAVLVVDETQTGFGRTGVKFAFERSTAYPDILVLGESLGGGMFPIAATMLTAKVNGFLNAHPLIHLSTFGGTDVGCHVALKSLEVYEREKPWENAASMGERLLRGVHALVERAHSPVRGVAGRGLLLSLDLGEAARAQAFCKQAAANGLLVLPGEVAKHTVVLRPSLLITEQETDGILEVLNAAAGSVV